MYKMLTDFYNVAILIMQLLCWMGAAALLLNLQSNISRFLSLKETQITMEYTIGPSDMDYFENIIKTCFDNYIYLKFNFIKDVYIKEEQENEMKAEITRTVVNSISNVLITKLGSVYNIEVIHEIIYNKVDLLVTAYVIDTNKMK